MPRYQLIETLGLREDGWLHSVALLIGCIAVVLRYDTLVRSQQWLYTNLEIDSRPETDTRTASRAGSETTFQKVTTRSQMMPTIHDAWNKVAPERK